MVSLVMNKPKLSYNSAFSLLPLHVNTQIASNLSSLRNLWDKDLCTFSVVCHEARSAVQVLRLRISKNMAFNRLPMEINEQIAYNLKNDKDLTNFSAVCRTTRDAVLFPRSGVWRVRFSEVFDVPSGKKFQQTRKEYQERMRYIQRHCQLSQGQQMDEFRCLRVMRDLIVESFSEACPISQRSKNQALLCMMVMKAGILRNILRAEESCTDGKATVNPLLYTIQLVLTSWAFKIEIYDKECNYDHRKIPSCIYTYPSAQKTAFRHPDRDPLVLQDTTVNVGRLLGISNYFKYHCTQETADTLRESFIDCPEEQLPRVWDTTLNDDTLKLRGKWRGFLAHLPQSELRRCRSRTITQSVSDEDVFVQITVSIHTSALNRSSWSRDLESQTRALPSSRLISALDSPEGRGFTQILQDRKSRSPRRGNDSRNESPTHSRTSSSPSPDPMRRQTGHGHDYQQFFGSVKMGGAGPFVLTSIAHRLLPLHGIPGWKRITLVLFSQSANPGYAAEAPDLAQFDINEIAYIMQGVMLPGGKVILGVWWNSNDHAVHRNISGPFILWNVPSEAEMNSTSKNKGGGRKTDQEGRSMDSACALNVRGDALKSTFPFWL